MTGGRRRLPGRLRRLLKWLAAIVATGAAILAGLYAASPAIATRAAPYLAARLGLTQLDLTIRRPDRRGIFIDRIAVASDAFALQAQDVRVDVTWRGLRVGRIDNLVVQALDVSVFAADNQSESSPGGEAPVPEIPIERISVAALTLRFPDTGFVGRGHAALGRDGLSVSLAGLQPEAASRLTLDASLTRDGEFDVGLRERDVVPPFLSLTGTLEPDTLRIAGSVDLHDFPLLLFSSLAGLPDGAGRVTAQVRTQLPWPLPDDVAWRELVVDVPAYGVDWRSDDGALAVQLNDGQARLELGTIQTRVGGEVALRTGEQFVRATFPAGYALTYAEPVLTGGAGLTLETRGPALAASLAVQAFSLHTGDTTRLDATAAVTSITQANRRIFLPTSETESANRLSLSASMTADRKFSVRLFPAGTDDTTPFIAADGALESAALSLAGTIDLRGLPFQWFANLATLPAGDGRLIAQAQTRLPWPLPEPVAWETLDANIPAFSVDWRSSDRALTLRLRDGAATLAAGKLTSRVGGQFSLRIGTSQVDVRLPPRYALTFADRTLRGGAGPTISVQSADATASLDLRRFALHTKENLRLELAGDVAGGSAAARAIGRIEGKITVTDVAKQRASGSVTFDGNVVAMELDRPARLTSDFRVDGPGVRANGSIDYGVIRDVRYEARHALDSGAGSAQASTTMTFTAPVAAQLLPHWDKTYDLDSASIDARVTADWDAERPIRGSALLKVSDGQAHYDDYLASGLSGELQLSSADVTQTEGWQMAPTRLHIRQIDIGLPVTDAFVAIALSGNTVSIAEAGGALLGGTATASAFDYDIATGDAMFDVTLDNLDLARVLALEGQHVGGDGRLDGRLPVQLRNNAPMVSEGRVFARPPGGTLRLNPALSQAGGQNELSFALKALANFHYTTLDATVDYAQDGDLKLGVRLQGRNPEVEKNRPIHYNLNISENIPVLLESLRLKDQFTERIEKKIRQ